MKYRVFIIFLFFPVFFIHGEGQYPNYAKGPLSSLNLYPLYTPFINLSPESAKNLGIGNYSISIVTAYANNFIRDHGVSVDNFYFDLDMGNYLFTISSNFGISKRLDLGFDFSFTIQYGGIFDGLIQGFHNAFNFPNGDREREAKYRCRFRVVNGNGSWIDSSEPCGGPVNLTLKAKILILDYPYIGFYLGLQPALKIPLNNNSSLLSSGKADVALNLLFEKAFRFFELYLNLGWAYLGRPDNLSIFDFNGNILNYMFGVEWILNRSWSLYFQVDGNTSPYRSGHYRIDRHSSTVNLGFKVKIFREGLLEVFFTEEFCTFAAADIGLTAAFSF